MKIPLVDLKAQFETIKEEVLEAVERVLREGVFIAGRETEEFERRMASYCRAKHAVAVDSGTAALHLALIASGLKEGKVVTTPLTFIATAEPIVHVGCHPSFVDVDEDTCLISVDQAVREVKAGAKAVIPVHLYGNPVPLDEVAEVAEASGSVLIEDCAQAHGAELRGRRVPLRGVGCFSFYPSKNLGAYGDGGCVVTNDNELAELVRELRDHGRKPGDKHVHLRLGFNYRMDEVQAAILNVKLRHLDEWIEKRRSRARLYNELLENVEGVTTPVEVPGGKHVYHLYVVKVKPKERDAVRDFLAKHGVSTSIHYPIPLHLQPSLAYLGLGEGSYPVAEKLCREVLSLPMYPELTDEQVLYVCEVLKQALKVH